MAAGRRVLVSGMGGDLGSRVAALLEDEPWVGELVGLDVDPPRRRLRPGDVPPRVAHRPRPHRRHDHGVQPARRRAHRGVGAVQPGQPGDGPPAHRRRGDLDPRRRRRVPGAGVGDRAQRHRDLRPGPRRADPARRVGRRRPDERVRAHARRHRAHRRGDRPAHRRHRRGDPHGHGARPARAEPARAGAADAGRARSACSPTRRSPSSRTSRSPGRSSPPPSGASPSRSTSSPTAPSPRCRRPAAGGASRSRSSARTGASPRSISGLLGAPIPDHVIETLHRGRLADNSRMGELLGFRPAATTMESIDKLYHWPTVVRIPARKAVA